MLNINITFIFKIIVPPDLIELLRPYGILLEIPKHDIFLQNSRQLARRVTIERLITQDIRVKHIESMIFEFEVLISAPIGQTILEIAHHNYLPLEGTCEGAMICATCHVIIENYSQPVTIEEEDTLDMLGERLTMNSRLGCQVKITEQMNGMRVRIPDSCCIR